jgi:hypothetical protein
MTEGTIMDQLIVDSRHTDETVELLADLPGVLPADCRRETDDKLRLTLVGPLRLDDYLPAARQRYADETDLARPDGNGLDVLVYDLRRRFADRYGFVPVIEGNGGDVEGDPQHKAIGAAYPVPEADIPATTAGEGVHIGVIDTALTHHDDLPPDLVRSDVVFGSEHPTLWAGHGTFVAGIIRQQAPAATIHMRTGLTSTDGKGTRWQLARDIAAFADEDIDILNLSLGFSTSDGAPPPSIARALSLLRPDVLVVAAAGNDTTGRRWPGAFGSVIDVSTDVPHAEPWVNAIAPGVDVTSTYLYGEVADSFEGLVRFHGYAKWTGTSFATAFVSGSVAARMSPTVSAAEALRLLYADPSSQVAKHSG